MGMGMGMSMESTLAHGARRAIFPPTLPVVPLFHIFFPVLGTPEKAGVMYSTHTWAPKTAGVS